MSELSAFFNLAVIGLTTYISYQGFKHFKLQEKYLFSTAHIIRYRQYYRLISSGFLHANWIHLIFNMFSLYSFGCPIENRFGPSVFLLIYFSGILGGNLLSLFLHKQDNYRALGASGGVCGIIFAAIFLLPGGSVYIFPFPFSIPSFLYAVLFILFSFYGIQDRTGNIGHDAHLGGAIIGLLMTTILYPSNVLQSPILFTIVIGMALLLFIYLYKHPLYFQMDKPLRPSKWGRIWSDIRFKGEKKRLISMEQTLDRLLEKISKTGILSLTKRERKILEKLSRKLREEDEDDEGI